MKKLLRILLISLIIISMLGMALMGSAFAMGEDPLKVIGGVILIAVAVFYGVATGDWVGAGALILVGAGLIYQAPIGGSPPSDFFDEYGGPYVVLSADKMSLPMDGIARATITINVKQGDQILQTLPDGYTLWASHMNLLALLYEGGTYLAANSSQNFDNIDTGYSFVNINSVDPVVVTPGSVASFKYSVQSQCQSVAIEISNTAGAIVYALAESAPNFKNPLPFLWNAKDKRGNPVPEGIYTVRLKALTNGGSTEYSQMGMVSVSSSIGDSDVMVTSYSNGAAYLTLVAPPPGSNNVDSVFVKLRDSSGKMVLGTYLPFYFTTGTDIVDPFKSSISANPPQVNADGNSYSTITVMARDSSGSPLPGQIVQFNSNRGSLDIFSAQNVVTDLNGVATVQIRSSSGGKATVSAIISGVSIGNAATIAFLPNIATFPRSTWGARDPIITRSDYFVYSGDLSIILKKETNHHDSTDNIDNLNQLDVIKADQNYHMDVNGWADLGYHFIIDRSGRVYQGRDIGVMGCHVANNNYGNIGVCLLGNYMDINLLPAQQQAVEDLLVYLCLKYNIATSNIYGHRDLGNTLCPGDNFYNKLPEIRAHVESKVR